MDGYIYLNLNDLIKPRLRRGFFMRISRAHQREPFSKRA
nr:MAG TPA: hypothetical protein [Caudoviricetes sp.]